MYHITFLYIILYNILHNNTLTHHTLIHTHTHISSPSCTTSHFCIPYSTIFCITYTDTSHTHTHTHTHTHHTKHKILHMHTNTCTHTHTCVCARMHAHAHTHTHTLPLSYRIIVLQSNQSMRRKLLTAQWTFSLQQNKLLMSTAQQPSNNSTASCSMAES